MHKYAHVVGQALFIWVPYIVILAVYLLFFFPLCDCEIVLRI